MILSPNNRINNRKLSREDNFLNGWSPLLVDVVRLRPGHELFDDFLDWIVKFIWSAKVLLDLRVLRDDRFELTVFDGGLPANLFPQHDSVNKKNRGLSKSLIRLHRAVHNGCQLNHRREEGRRPVLLCSFSVQQRATPKKVIIWVQLTEYRNKWVAV